MAGPLERGRTRESLHGGVVRREQILARSSVIHSATRTMSILFMAARFSSSQFLFDESRQTGNLTIQNGQFAIHFLNLQFQGTDVFHWSRNDRLHSRSGELRNTSRTMRGIERFQRLKVSL